MSLFINDVFGITMAVPEPLSLLIVSHVVHYRYEDRLFAYGPYVREIDIWADLFPRVFIASPCRTQIPHGDCLPFLRSNITILPQRETGGESFSARLSQILALPILISGLICAMRKADAIHVRCPGNLGLLGTVLAPFFSRKLIAKYAGQWSDYPGEAWTVRLQKILLRSQWWHGPVTVYGSWPAQPAHVVPFFTSILTVEQVARARRAVETPRSPGPLRVLYVGRLSAPKHVDILLSAIVELGRRFVVCECTVVGDGPERPALEAQVTALGPANRVRIVGAVEHERVLDFYENADVLVLASETEGWPKAIAEGMAFGLVCIGSSRGLVPQMLGEGRGLIVPPGDVSSLTEVLERIANDLGAFSDMRLRAARWAEPYSLEGLRDALGRLMEESWKVVLPSRPQVGLHDG